MSVAEVKRGRPKSKPETEPVPSAPTITDSRESWRPQKPKPVGPACHRCGEPTGVSATLLSKLGMKVVRCEPCGWAGIEGDSHTFEYNTAASGAVLRRALVLYELKYPTRGVPSVAPGSFAEILFSDDDRWETEQL